MRAKITGYRRNLSRIEQKFDRECVVIFVIETLPEKVIEFVESERTEDFFVFIDLKSYCAIPVGQTLQKAPFYWWNGYEVEVISIV